MTSAVREALGLGGSSDPSPGELDLDISLDIAFELLKNERRRLVVAHLGSAEGTATLDKVARHVAQDEYEVPEGQRLDSQDRKRVYIGLYQCHLPKLDDAGVIDFNKDRGVIAPTPRLDDLATLLEPAEAMCGDGGAD